MSSYGHLYEFLINRSLAQIVSKKNVHPDIITGLLVETAYYMFINQKKAINDHDISIISEQYNIDYDESIVYKEYIQDLVSVNIFHKYGEEVYFKYSYAYYYYIAKYLSYNIQESKVVETIERMTSRLYNEEYGNIIIFLCHITKNVGIFKSIIKNAMQLYKDKETCDFTCQNDYLSQIDTSISELIDPKTLPEGTLSERTEKYLKEKDKRESSEEPNNLGKLYEETEDPQINEMLRINNAFKTMEVMGQILKNYPGTLRTPIKRDLVINTYNLGMRTLSVVYDIISNEIEPFIEKIKSDLSRGC